MISDWSYNEDVQLNVHSILAKHYTKSSLLDNKKSGHIKDFNDKELNLFIIYANKNGRSDSVPDWSFMVYNILLDQHYGFCVDDIDSI